MSCSEIPIFVLGKHRSGTTGLANHLSEHHIISSIQHEVHEGIHESAYFSHIEGRYGDISKRENFEKMVEVLARSDYFRIAGVDKDFLLSLWPTDYHSFFQKVMDWYAESQGAQYWVEKTPDHTLHARRLAKVYPSAQFVCIVRPLDQVLTSYLAYDSVGARKKRAKWGRIGVAARTSALWAYFNKVIHSMKEKFPERTHVVSYKEFANSTPETLEEVCEFLGVGFDENMLSRSYEPNSSFQGECESDGVKRSRELSLIELCIGYGVARVVRILPLSILDEIYHKVRTHPSGKSLPRWFFRLRNSR